MSAVLENQISDDPPVEVQATPAHRLPTRLRLYYLSKRTSDATLFRIHRFIEAVHTGFWLGILDNDQIRAALFRHYAEAELYTTSAHNLHGFIPCEKEMITDYFAGCRSAVVAAAGGGREMIALAQLGFDVAGFECNSTLLKTCEEFLMKAGVSARVLQAQPDCVPSGLAQYDCGIVGWGAYAHMLGQATRVAFMRDLKKHLSPGAPVFVSVGRRPIGSRYYGFISRIARTIRALRLSRERIEIGDDLLNCFSHRFVESELRSELQEAGFETVACTETHEIYVVARA